MDHMALKSDKKMNETDVIKTIFDARRDGSEANALKGGNKKD